MDPVELPHDLNLLGDYIKSCINCYKQEPTKKGRMELRRLYRAAAEKYNRLAGRGCYLLSISLQKKTLR
jgi:hypothetical protein